MTWFVYDSVMVTVIDVVINEASCRKLRPGGLEMSIQLHISTVVYGRSNLGNRVHYVIDPEGVRSETGSPERVVLVRWRQRQRPGWVFSGTRLSPTVWRAVAFAFGPKVERLCGLSVEAIEAQKEQMREALKERRLSLPEEANLHALAQACGPKVLRALVDRHTSPDHAGHSGVPDLFLYARETASGRLTAIRFVEVKKPGERTSPDQIAEIAFMQSLGLPARKLVLIERSLG